jgi:hypothetical protein
MADLEVDGWVIKMDLKEQNGCVVSIYLIMGYIQLRYFVNVGNNLRVAREEQNLFISSAAKILLRNTLYQWS